MYKNYWKTWAKAAGVRAVKTFFQSFASLMTVGAVISELDWVYIASASAVSAIYSLATSLAGLPEITEEGEADDE
jgi:hypothetical protein